MIQLEKTNLKALGEYVILVSEPTIKGDEQYTKSGIFIGEAQESKLPELCAVYDVGCDVPKDFVKVGDLTALPTGAIRNVPNLDVVQGKIKESEVRQKYVTCHYKSIPCVYRDVN